MGTPSGLTSFWTSVLWAIRSALRRPIRWVAPPSVKIPRSASEPKRAKQLSGIASASKKSRFIADISGIAPGNCNSACR